MVAAIAFLVAYAVPILNPDLPDWAATTCRWMAWVAWALFVADYLARLLLPTNRRRYILRHPLDLPVIVLPLLRPLRLLRASSAPRPPLTRRFVGPVGLEPTTRGLKVRCSAN